MHKGCMNFEGCEAASRDTPLGIASEKCPFCGGSVRLFIYTFDDCVKSKELENHCGFCGNCLTDLTALEKQQHISPHIKVKERVEPKRKKKRFPKRDPRQTSLSLYPG